MSVAHSWVTVLQTVTALIQKDPLSAEVSALEFVLKKLCWILMQKIKNWTYCSLVCLLFAAA